MESIGNKLIHSLANILYMLVQIQCFDIVGWVTGRASMQVQQFTKALL